MIKRLLATTAILTAMSCSNPAGEEGTVDTLYIEKQTVANGTEYKLLFQDSGVVEIYNKENNHLIWYQGHYSNLRDSLILELPDSIEVVYENFRRNKLFTQDITLNDSMYYQFSFTKWDTIIKDSLRPVH